MVLQVPLVRWSLEHFQRLEQLGLRKLKSDAHTLRDFTAKRRVFADFVEMVAHVLAAPSKPEISKPARARRVIQQAGIAVSAEGMKPAPPYPEACQTRLQAAAHDVALTERLPIAGAEEVPALGWHLSHRQCLAWELPCATRL